jgi:ethanolamine permease
MNGGQGEVLSKSLNGLHLWGIAVGLVIGGEYFGWSYGWAEAGTFGFLITTVFVATMYTTFIFSFTELTAAIPRAGGPFAYSLRAFGPIGGLVSGFATLVEFLFGPPAGALAIGAYLNVQFPGLDPKQAAVGCYIVFMALNILGVKTAAAFEFCVTVVAVLTLLGFMGVVAPAFAWSNFSAGGWAGASTPSLSSFPGILAATPFAMWFFLAIEGTAMAAEEAKNPAKTIPKAYIAGIITLVVLAFGTMISAGGVGDWRALANINDPLPRAMEMAIGSHGPWLSAFVWLSLFGLVASMNGIIMTYSRQILALSRAGFLPRVLGRVSPRRKTPHWAIIAGGVLGIAAIHADELVSFGGHSLTATLLTMSVTGALVMYITSMVSLFQLRRTEPALKRPFKAPCYPVVPAIALGTAIICLAMTIYYNFMVFGLFMAMFAMAWLFHHFTYDGVRSEVAAPAEGHAGSI